MDRFDRVFALKQKIKEGEPTHGLFVRTPAPQIIEALGTTGVDFLVLDAEHAPFGAADLDVCIMAAEAVGIAVLVRIPNTAPSTILKVLDMGASGIIIPHVCSATQARAVVSATRYSGGTRGFSGSHRAASYGALPAAEFIAKSDKSLIVIGQIEDAIAVDDIDSIAAVSEMDALFIGPADLTLSLGATSPDDPKVVQAMDKICAAGRKAGQSLGTFLPSTQGVSHMRSKGISLFIIGTDQGLLRKTVTTLAKDFKGISNA